MIWLNQSSQPIATKVLFEFVFSRFSTQLPFNQTYVPIVI